MFQKVSLFVCVCVITGGCAVAFPTVVQSGPVSHLICFARSPIFPDQSSHQYQYNYQNCQNIGVWEPHKFRKKNKITISWSKPRVSFENSRGSGLMVSDNVPAASFGDSGRALLNKIKEQPSNYAAMSSTKSMSNWWFCLGHSSSSLKATEPSNDPSVRCKLNPKRSQPIQCSLGGRWWIFSGAGTPDRKKEGNQLGRRWQFREADSNSTNLEPYKQTILRVLDLWRFSKVVHFNGDHDPFQKPRAWRKIHSPCLDKTRRRNTLGPDLIRDSFAKVGVGKFFGGYSSTLHEHLHHLEWLGEWGGDWRNLMV